MCLNIGTPKTINFPFETNGKLMVVGVPILKHFRVMYKKSYCTTPGLGVGFSIGIDNNGGVNKNVKVLH